MFYLASPASPMLLGLTAAKRNDSFAAPCGGAGLPCSREERPGNMWSLPAKMVLLPGKIMILPTLPSFRMKSTKNTKNTGLKVETTNQNRSILFGGSERNNHHQPRLGGTVVQFWSLSGAARTPILGKIEASSKESALPIDMAVCQNLVPLVNIEIAGKWMFIP